MGVNDELYDPAKTSWSQRVVHDTNCAAMFAGPAR
jgi:hypothetical protein